MRKALGLAAMIIVLGIFMPDVLHAAETFLLTLFDTATVVLNTTLPANTADVSASVR